MPSIDPDDSRLCLGIESTAHTFGVGILNFKGDVLSVVNDTYVPESGGLHPRKVVEHHNAVYLEVIEKALDKANCELKDIDLISFSQGPGLGPCLRIGAAVARTLSQKLDIPLVGSNHCISHVEIGRRESGFEDPLTLYVSGGNTIVSAFQSGRYRVFGETLDIAVGNLIDMVARDMGIPHPGGPRIEKLAKKATQYLELPYVVKGMDLSFSGIYTECKKLIESNDFGKKYTAADVAYSLQETAYAMLAEVTERGLAHTEKNEVLLTGGVAANKRLQSMIRYIAEEHNAKFYVVPLRLAGDNGAMLGWSGVLYYLNKGGMSVTDTLVDPRWRMDEVYTPWRHDEAEYIGMEYSPKKTDVKPEDGLEFPESKAVISEKQKVIRKGAEAELIKTELAGEPVIVKHRLEKKYRIPQIDSMIRNMRTTAEARTLIRMKRNGVPIPIVYEIDATNAAIVMSYIDGKRLKDEVKSMSDIKIQATFRQVGVYIARLHMNHEIHGDLTTSNIMVTGNQMFFIDFGLGFNSSSAEDKSVDLHLFKRVITSTHGDQYENMFPPFLKGYTEEYKLDDLDEIIAGIEDVELRGRYIKRDKRKRGIIKK